MHGAEPLELGFNGSAFTPQFFRLVAQRFREVVLALAKEGLNQPAEQKKPSTRASRSMTQTGMS
jgi:hypothetical protein